MKKLVLLLALTGLLLACWDDDNDWGSDHFTLTVNVSDACHHPPFRIYIDGKDSSDKVGQIEEAGGTILVVLERGWHHVYVRDDDGDWIFEDEVNLDDDRTVWVDC
jgi:hypothetical protein